MFFFIINIPFRLLLHFCTKKQTTSTQITKKTAGNTITSLNFRNTELEK